MSQSFQNGHQPFLRKVESLLSLDAEERDAIERLPIIVRDVHRHQDIARQGDRPSQCCLILDGCVSRYKTSRDAKRQILAFHFPGDIPDFQNLYVATMDYSLSAMTRAKIGYVQHRAMAEFLARFPRIKDVLWHDVLVEASIGREWTLNIGTRNATKRLAHMLAEVFLRLRTRFQMSEGPVQFPITQEEIGDALGITPVHVNRALQEIRGLGIVRFEGGSLEIPDWEAIAAYCNFDATYLHLR